MNRKLFAAFSVLLFTVLMVSNASAQRESLMGDSISEVEPQEVDLQTIKQVFNENTEQLPGFAKSLVGDQTVQIKMGEDVDLQNSSIGFKTDEMNITEIKWGSYEDTTLRIKVTGDDLESILSSRSSLNTAGKMLETGDLEYEALTIGNKVRMSLFRLFTGI